MKIDVRGLRISPLHRDALHWFSAHSGKEVSWPAPIDTMYLMNRAKGIHKPRGSQYALSVRKSLGGPYIDEVERMPNGSWQLNYAQEGNDPSYFTNAGLQACMRDGIPVGVVVQIKEKPKPQYLVLGVGQVVAFDAAIFKIKS